MNYILLTSLLSTLHTRFPNLIWVTDIQRNPYIIYSQVNMEISNGEVDAFAIEIYIMEEVGVLELSVYYVSDESEFNVKFGESLINKTRLKAWVADEEEVLKKLECWIKEVNKAFKNNE